MANRFIALSLTTIIAASSAYPLAALSALLGGNGLSANLNNFDGNPNLRQQENPIQSTNSCPCSNPKTEIFVTETPRGAEIVAAETTNGNGLSLATINDDRYARPEPEGSQEPGRSTLPSRIPVSPALITDQTIPVYPSRSYAGSLSGSGHLGHSMSASGSLAGNLGYSSSMSGSTSGLGHGFGHVGSMAGSLAGPHGSMAGSLAGSHGMHGGSLAGSLAGIHHGGGSMAGSLSGSHNLGGGSMSASISGNNRNIAEGLNSDRVAAGNHDESSFPAREISGEDRTGNDQKNRDQTVSGSEKKPGDSSAPNPAGSIAEDENLQYRNAMAGSLASASHQNGGSALAGSMASSTGNGHAQAGSIAGAQGNGIQGNGGGSAMSGSLAGSHNGMAHAVSSAIAGYHHHHHQQQQQQHATLSPEQETSELQQPGEISRRNFNGNENINRNVNYNTNTYG